MKVLVAIGACIVLIVLEAAVVLVTTPEEPDEEWERHRWWQRPM